jgi:iron complex outermembrane receptor protein
MRVGADTRVDFGARLQWVRFSGKDRVDAGAPGAWDSAAPDFDRSDRVHMLELGLRHDLREHLALFTKASRSARLATVDELFESKFDPASFASARVFSPLEPQTSTGLDLGLDYHQDATRITLTAYYLKLRNEIHFDAASFDNVNLDPTHRHGLELVAEHAFSPAFRLRGNYAYTRARFRDGPHDGNELPLVPRHTASLAGIWTLQPATRLAATVRYEGEKYFDNDQANDFGRKIPAYTLVDLKLSHERDAWTAGLAVNNLFDREAYDYGVRSTFSPGVYNAYPLPERSFTLSLARAF